MDDLFSSLDDGIVASEAGGYLIHRRAGPVVPVDVASDESQS